VRAAAAFRPDVRESDQRLNAAAMTANGRSPQAPTITEYKKLRMVCLLVG
jgi:hypothetical protein